MERTPNGREVIFDNLAAAGALATPGGGGIAHGKSRRESDGPVTVDFKMVRYALRRRRQSTPPKVKPMSDQTMREDSGVIHENRTPHTSVSGRVI